MSEIVSNELAEAKAENARLRGLLEEFADHVEEIACDDAGCSVENLLAKVVQVRAAL